MWQSFDAMNGQTGHQPYFPLQYTCTDPAYSHIEFSCNQSLLTVPWHLRGTHYRYFGHAASAGMHFYLPRLNRGADCGCYLTAWPDDIQTTCLSGSSAPPAQRCTRRCFQTCTWRSRNLPSIGKRYHSSIRTRAEKRRPARLVHLGCREQLKGVINGQIKYLDAS